MKVLKPLNVTSSILDINIPEPDTARGEVQWTAGTYSAGTERVLTETHRRYRATTSTTDKPDAGALKDPPTWINIGPTNAFAMFDDVNGTQSKRDLNITAELTPNVNINGVAMFNVTGATSVTVTMNDPTDGEVYSRQFDMIDNSEIADYWNYFFNPIISRTEFVVLDLPAFSAATTTVSIDGSAEVAAGTLVIGNQIALGVTTYGTTLKLFDASIKVRDEFGNFTVIPRRTSKTVEFDFYCDTQKVGYVFQQLQRLTSIPAVWLGTDTEDDSTLVFGYYEDSAINISAPSVSSCSLTIQGLT